MTKNQLKTIGLTTALAMSLSYAQAAEALFVHPADGSSAASSALDNIQRITFSDGDMSVKPFGGDADVYILDNIAKITFGNIEITDVTNLPATGLDVVVYVTPAGGIVVESPEAIQMLTLFNVDGKILRSVAAATATVETHGRASLQLQTTLDASTLPTGVYLLQIKTQQGVVTKKIIKK